MTNIILCGGSGTRLWPISRTLMPKQFVKLFSHKSLFQLTVERNSKLCKSSFIVSNSEQYFLALDQLEELNIENNRYLLEPIARNTAPAIALACMQLDYDEIVLVTPSDHLIKDERYIPTTWTSDETGKSGTFALSGGNYTSTYTPSTAGSYTITATFQKQTWNGTTWVAGTTDTKTTHIVTGKQIGRAHV